MKIETLVLKSSASKEASFSTTAVSAALGASLMKRLNIGKEKYIGF